jgi:hypothetical protein
MGVKGMRRLVKSRRGLSTVISTILMIMVVMVGMSVAFGMVISYSDSYQRGVGSSVLESVTIEETWLHNGILEFWIYNTGNLPINIKSIYVNDVPLTIVTFDGQGVSSALSINGKVPIGGHDRVVASWDKGTGYFDFKIATERGSLFKQSVRIGVNP